MSRFIIVLLFAAAGAFPVWASSAQVAATNAPAGPPETLAGWAQGAQLFDGLGTFHRKITTRSSLAQKYFDQGMRFTWAFNHDEATRSFAKAAMIDPQCASCFWGVALSLGPNYNMPMMSSPRGRVGWQAVHNAEANAHRATPIERALIAAVGQRYRGSGEVDPSNSKPLLQAYVNAMRAVAAKYPNDLDVQTMYAEGLMNTNPWKLWNANGTKNPGTQQILDALQYVIKRDPKHPGANHYYIHAIEASPHPEQALASAKVLNGMMPAAGHLEHMPAHILQRVGRYEEAAEANRKGAAADLAYLKKTAAPDYYPMYLIHNFQFLGSAAAMEGRRAEAIMALRQARTHMPDQMLLDMPGLDWGASFIYDGYTKFGMWSDMLKEPAPSPKLAGATISYLQSRAIALAATGKINEAEIELAKAKELIAAVPAAATQGNNVAKPLYQIGQLKAQARVATAEGKREEAIHLLMEAVSAEDSLAYNEPSDMIFATRHLLGAELLAAGTPEKAEAVYREDLKQHPNNGWAYLGLTQALASEKKDGPAAAAKVQFERAWRGADVQTSRTGILRTLILGKRGPRLLANAGGPFRAP
jgi:tetratricopeptide (TPR) repeat protein